MQVEHRMNERKINDIAVVNDEVQQNNDNSEANNDNYIHLAFNNSDNTTKNNNFNIGTNLATNTVVNSNSVQISATKSDGFITNNTIEVANTNRPPRCIVSLAAQPVTIQSVTNVVSCNTIISSGAVAEKKRKIEVIAQQFFFPKEIQTDLTMTDVDMLFKYYQEAVEERDSLLLKISTLIIDVDYLKGNDKKTRFYTGLPTWSLLNNFFEMVGGFLPNHFRCKLSQFQMLILTLMKLRLNLSFTDLGYRFQIDETTASRYFHRCLFVLFKLFNETKLIHWPERKNLLMNVPSYFHSTFKETITIIVDCFEIFIEHSSVLLAAAQGFSRYKHHATLKFLIGISVTGAILFVSIGYGGRASDKEVVNKSGFLDQIQEGDIIMADKGFLIEDEVEARNASLKMPSFVRNGGQLHPTEIEQSRDIARIRIHVERVIGVLREKFNICSDTAQMSAVAKQNDLYDNDLYDKIIYVCSCLVNLCPSVVSNDFEM